MFGGGGENPAQRLGDARGPEHRQPCGQVACLRILAQTGTHLVQILDRMRHPDLGAHRAEEAGLPDHTLGDRFAGAVEVGTAGSRPGGPCGEHGRPGRRVAGEQVGDLSRGGVPAALSVLGIGESLRTAGPTATVAPGRVRSDVPGDDPERVVVDTRVENTQHRPDQPARTPRIVHPTGAGQGERRPRMDRRHDPIGQVGRRREIDVRADPVAGGTGAESAGQMLLQPALHAACGHTDDLGRERIGRCSRCRQDAGKHVGQYIGAFGAVDDQHRCRFPLPPLDALQIRHRTTPVPEYGLHLVRQRQRRPG